MGGFIISYFIGLLLLFGGNQNRTDLLDTLSTDIYWQIKAVHPDSAQLQKDAGPDVPIANLDKLVKDLTAEDFPTRDKARQELERAGPGIAPLLKPAAESKDPEVAAVAASLLKKFAEHAQERAIRRLMAIRTLGERKDKAAEPFLNTLTTSKEVFVADYARRAIAQIEGKPPEPADLSGELQKDVSLLPREANLVAQTTGLSQEVITVASFLDISVDAANGGVAPNIGGPPAERRLDKKALLVDISKQILGLVEHVGNVRLDAITVGFSHEKADAGWAVLIVRGKYDPIPMYAALEPLVRDELGAPNGKAAPNPSAGDIPLLTGRDGEMSVLFPSSDQLVIIMNDKNSAVVRDRMMATLKTGKGTFSENKELAALMARIDTKSPAWVVVKQSNEMRKDEETGNFAVATLDTKATKEGIAVSLKAEGDDPAKVKVTVDTINLGVKEELADMQRQAQIMPVAQPMVDFIQSIKVSADGKNATLVCQIKPGVMHAIFGFLGPTILEQLQHQNDAPEALMPANGPPANVPPPPEILPNPIENKGK